MDIKSTKKGLKLIYGQYIHANMEFYMQIFVSYLKSLNQSETHTLEDIEVFEKVVTLFSLMEDFGEDDDLKLEKTQRDVSTVDGFIDL